MNPTKLSLYYVDGETRKHYRIQELQHPAELGYVVRDNPAMNRTFLGRPEVREDLFLGCYINGDFVGACLGHNMSGYQIEMHPAIDRINHKESIKIFAELAALWCLQRKLFPYLCVPDNMPNVQGWVERTLGWTDKDHMESTRNIEGNIVTSSVYLMPPNWQPRYVNDVVSHWN